MAKPKRRRCSGRIAPGLEGFAVPVRGLKVDPDNARTHPIENIDAIKRSLKEFGQQKPIVVGRGGKVIAGNGMLQAARELGWKQIAAVKTDLKEGRQRGYAIADNRSAELANWDIPVLEDELARLQEVEGISAADLGFDAGALSGGEGACEVIEEFIPTAPDRMVWIFMGIPLSQFAMVQAEIEKMERVANIKVDVVRDGQKG